MADWTAGIERGPNGCCGTRPQAPYKYAVLLRRFFPSELTFSIEKPLTLYLVHSLLLYTLISLLSLCRMFKSLLRIISLSLVVMSSASATYHGGAPLLSSADAHTIENKYIVSFRPEVTEAEIRAHNNYVFTTLLDVTNASSSSIVTHYFDSHILKGYAGRFEPHVLDTLRASPIVSATIERLF
jgi:hypothetical protein